jgi:hypothetical protein
MASTSAAPVAAPAVDPRREREAALTEAVNSLDDAKFGLHGKASMQQGGAVKLQFKGKNKIAFQFPLFPHAQPTSKCMRRPKFCMGGHWSMGAVPALRAWAPGDTIATCTTVCACAERPSAGEAVTAAKLYKALAQAGDIGLGNYQGNIASEAHLPASAFTLEGLDLEATGMLEQVGGMLFRGGRFAAADVT